MGRPPDTQAHDRRQHLLGWQSSARQILLDPCAYFWQQFTEQQHLAVLTLVPHLAPTSVIPIPLAAACIATYGLQVAGLDRSIPAHTPGELPAYGYVPTFPHQ